jgi:hypothetical protein
MVVRMLIYVSVCPTVLSHLCVCLSLFLAACLLHTHTNTRTHTHAHTHAAQGDAAECMPHAKL